MSEGPPHDGSTLSLTFIVSSEPAFLGTAEALIARVGEHAGCTADAAMRLGQAVRRTLGELIARARAGQHATEFEVAFSATSRIARVDVACVGGPVPGPSGAAEGSLALDGEEAAVRRLVDRLEFGRDGDRPYCRLTQQVRPAR